MSEAKTGTLAEALSALQGELKPVRRNTEGQVGQRKRKYADLAAVAVDVYPLLGKYGLSFSAKPTLKEGRFVLAYKLRHVGGEEDEGDWPLNGGPPQQVGSEITYARRYCLCAVTGAVPEGEDDDGQEAQQAEHDWRSQPAVQPKRFAHTDAEHERLVPGQNTEDRTGKKAERIKGKAPDDEFTTPAETDAKWYGEVEAEIVKFTTDEYGEVLRRRVVEKTEAGGCTKEDAEKLRTLIRARRQAIAVEQAPPVTTDA